MPKMAVQKLTNNRICNQKNRGTKRQNICSEDDLRSRIFGTFVVKFNFLLVCLCQDIRISKKWYNCPFFNGFLS